MLSNHLISRRRSDSTRFELRSSAQRKRKLLRSLFSRERISLFSFVSTASLSVLSGEGDALFYCITAEGLSVLCAGHDKGTQRIYSFHNLRLSYRLEYVLQKQTFIGTLDEDSEVLQTSHLICRAIRFTVVVISQSTTCDSEQSCRLCASVM